MITSLERSDHYRESLCQRQQISGAQFTHSPSSVPTDSYTVTLVTIRYCSWQQFKLVYSLFSHNRILQLTTIQACIQSFQSQQNIVVGNNSSLFTVFLVTIEYCSWQQFKLVYSLFSHNRTLQLATIQACIQSFQSQQNIVVGNNSSLFTVFLVTIEYCSWQQFKLVYSHFSHN